MCPQALQPLHAAAFNGYTAIVRQLLADPRVDPTAVYVFERDYPMFKEVSTALDMALVGGHADTILVLEEDPRVPRIGDSSPRKGSSSSGLH